MKRGAKFLVSTTMLAVAACGGGMGKLEIRSTPTALAAGQRAVHYRIAEARGQLRLGNVALALEAFRIAAREDPNSIDAFAGMAACYDMMGRYDLSRRNYETALALAPADPGVLAAFAASLQQQGLNEEAQSVRQEIAARAAAKAAAETQLAAAAASEPAAAPASVKAAAPPIVLPEPKRGPAPVELAAAAPERVAVAVPAVQPAQVEAVAEASVPQAAPVGRSVTIKLPPARRVDSAPAVAGTAVATVATGADAGSLVPAAVPLVAMDQPVQPREPAPDSMPALAPYDRPIPRPRIAEERGPRLQRLSMGEIALISAPVTTWRPTVVTRNAEAARVRFVPLREASTLPVKVRLLNAARVDRLAARTRGWLVDHGWRGLAIGDAPVTRSRSVILYPAQKLWLAQRLSRQFGFPIAEGASGTQITMLLGSDAARHPALRSARG